MAYVKFQGNNLFTGREMLDGNQVLIMEKTGRFEAIVPVSEAGDDVQRLDGVISPGFVNTHCHLELSHMRGLLSEGTGLVDFVMGVMQQRSFSPEKILESIAGAEAEMLAGGIVAVGDICNTTHTIAQKTAGRLAYYNFMEVSGFVPAGAAARFEQAVKNYSDFRAAGLDGAITAHAPYSVSTALFEMINEQSAGKIVSVHNQETPEEDAFFRDGVSRFRELYTKLGVDLSFYEAPGCTSLQHWLPLLDKPAHLLLVHNTCSTPADISTAIELSAARGQKLYWAVCPNANNYIEDRMPPVNELLSQGCAITVGTDSLASNHQLSILSELKTLQSGFPQLTAEQLLRWATLNGAEALQMEDRLGSFEAGRLPGVLEIEKGFNQVRRLL